MATITTIGNDNPSLVEFLASAQRGSGTYNSILGPDFIQKQIANGTFLGIQQYLDNITGDIFTTTFGTKVWQNLNNQTKTFMALDKTEWGRSAGWRVRTDRGAGRTAPVYEGGSLPPIDVSNYETVASFPKTIASMFGVSQLATFMSNLDGGVGDALAGELEACETDHAKALNQGLVSSGAVRVSADGTLSGTTVSFIPNDHESPSLWPGDLVKCTDTQAGSNIFRVTAINAGSGQNEIHVVMYTSGATLAANMFSAGSKVYAVRRTGLTSLDDITHYNDAPFAGTAVDVGLYDLNTDVVFDIARGTRMGTNRSVTRSVGSWAGPANSGFNGTGGVGRDLTLPLIDGVFSRIRRYGGEPRLIITNLDQYYRLTRLLQAQQRYVGVENYEVGVGGSSTFPGTRGGMTLSSYQNVPILVDPDICSSISSSGTTLGSNMYILDTDYINIGVALPTQYVENRDFINANSPLVRGLFYSMMELRCTNLRVQGSIRDLNE